MQPRKARTVDSVSRQTRGLTPMRWSVGDGIVHKDGLREEKE
jgi:hypothetical protein